MEEGAPVSQNIAKLEVKLRMKKYKNGCSVSKFLCLFNKFDIDDVASYSILSNFVFYKKNEDKLYHIKSFTKNPITEH